MGCGAVLMKGGHLDDDESPDWLFTRDGELRFTAPRVHTKIPTVRVHALCRAGGAASTAQQLGRYGTRGQNVALGRAGKADTLEVGHGIGPVHHFHAWW